MAKINNITQLLEIYGVPEDKLDWNLICIEQRLSETFMNDYRDKINFKLVPIYQKLSEEFIKDNDNKLNFYTINKYQEVSNSFKKDYRYKLENANLIQETGEFVNKGSETILPYQILSTGIINIYKDDLKFSKNINDFMLLSQDIPSKLVTSADSYRINSNDYSCYLLFVKIWDKKRIFINIDLIDNPDRSIIKPILDILKVNYGVSGIK